MRKKILLLIFIVGTSIIFTLTGCGKKLKTITYTDKEKTKTSINIKVPEKSNFTLSENKKDLKTSRENAIIKGEKFDIAIQFDKFYTKSNMDTLKKIYKNYNDFREVTYNKTKGFVYYYPLYIRYVVVLPINEKSYVSLHIYAKESSTKEAGMRELFDSQEVQDILKTVSFN